jgi:phosphoglycerol transferase MdoB-like AlkP superfamily enzyme
MGGNNKLFSIILISLLGLSALLSVLFMFDVVSEGLLITWCYVLLGVAVVVTLGFSVMGMAQNPKNAKNALIGVAALVLICVIAYFMSGNEVHSNIDGDILADAGTSQLSEGGLIAFYILGVVAIGAIVFTEISKAFK